MTPVRFCRLRERLSGDSGGPVVAVPVFNEAEACAVRGAGGAPFVLGKETTDGVIAFDASTQDTAAIRTTHPNAYMLDVGPPQDEESALRISAAGADAVSVGALGYGDGPGTPGERARIYALESTGSSVAAVSGGLNAVRLLGFFENLGHTDVIVVARRGVAGHLDGLSAGVLSLRLAARCRFEGGRVFEFARANPAFARAFASFAGDADALYPQWRKSLEFPPESAGDH